MLPLAVVCADFVAGVCVWNAGLVSCQCEFLQRSPGVRSAAQLPGEGTAFSSSSPMCQFPLLELGGRGGFYRCTTLTPVLELWLQTCFPQASASWSPSSSRPRSALFPAGCLWQYQPTSARTRNTACLNTARPRRAAVYLSCAKQPFTFDPVSVHMY